MVCAGRTLSITANSAATSDRRAEDKSYLSNVQWIHPSKSKTKQSLIPLSLSLIYWKCRLSVSLVWLQSYTNLSKKILGLLTIPIRFSAGGAIFLAGNTCEAFLVMYNGFTLPNPKQNSILWSTDLSKYRRFQMASSGKSRMTSIVHKPVKKRFLACWQYR